MLAGLLSTLLRAVWPQAPAWLAPLLVELVPEIVALVREIRAASDGPVSPEVVVERVGALLDVVLDDVPQLRDWTEAQRDALIAHLSAIALLVARIEDEGSIDRQAVRSIRKGLRKARREL